MKATAGVCDVIGIDPDLEKNGVAIIRNRVIYSLQKLRFVELMELVDSNPDAIFAVEDVEFNRLVFNRNLKPSENLKVAQNVGMVKGVARHIFEYLEHRDCRCVRVRPLRGDLKRAKKNAAYFNQITGWQGRSNQDCRDAALLAFFGIKSGQLVLRPSEVPY